jgi:hypothetical protein
LLLAKVLQESHLEMKIKLSKHAQHVLMERGIPEVWVWKTIDESDWQEMRADNNLHCFKSIPERAGRILHVTINTNAEPQNVITVFFDRRERKRS